MMVYYGIMIFISFFRYDTYPEAVTAKGRRALRQLATRFVIHEETLYRRTVDGVLLLCINRDSVDRVMREVYAGVCGPPHGRTYVGS